MPFFSKLFFTILTFFFFFKKYTQRFRKQKLLRYILARMKNIQSIQSVSSVKQDNETSKEI